jgi:hypothetical protein
MLSRLALLIQRMSSRIKIPKVVGSLQSTTSPLSIATQRFAQRILHDNEQVEWKQHFSGSMHHTQINDAELQWLASR